METYRRIEGLTDFIAAKYRIAAEIGIGHFPDAACALLKKGLKVFATDILPVHHAGIRIVIDDVTSPDTALYNDIDLIYSLRPPPELVPYMKILAEVIPADLIIKPLSSEYPEGFRLMRNGSMPFFVWRCEK